MNTFNAMDQRVLQQNPVQVVAGSTVGTLYTYDVLDRVQSMQPPGESATTVSYSNGNVMTALLATKVVTEPSGATVTTSYDSDGEPGLVTYGGVSSSPPTPSQSFTYDAVGRVIEADAGTVTTSRSYDSVGDVLSVTRAGSTVSYGLVAPGKIGTIRYPNNQVVTRGYDTSGRWDSVTDWTGLAQAATTFGFDDDGNVNQVKLGNGTAVSVVFDADGNPSSATYKFTGGSWPITYSRGSAGELTGVSQWGGSSAYTYDPVQQLTGSTGPATTTGFDAAGEPTTVGGNTQAFTVAGRLCWSGSTTGSCGTPPSGATSFTFDGNGDRTSAGSNSYGFDANAMMTTATTPAGSSSYAYSADGLRTSKTVAGVTTAFAYDDVSGSTPELIGDGNGFYLYGPNGLPFEYLPNGSGATPEWLFCDATTGSVGSVTDTTGTIIATHAYDPWGNTTATTGTPVSLGWHAQYQDPETHFYNLWHRYYDPATAQFTTPDPLYALTGERYGYADNDPINGEDLTGLWWGEGTLHNIAHTVNNDVIKPVERTNVKTDLAVVGMAAGVAALTVATGGLGDAVLGVSAATVGFAASATSVGIGAGIAAIDCSHRADAKCVFEAASAAAGFAGGELSLGGDMVSELGADWGDLGDYMSGVGDYALGGVWGLGYGIPTLFMRDAMDQRAAKCGA